jgi:hypothetical protein
LRKRKPGGGRRRGGVRVEAGVAGVEEPGAAAKLKRRRQVRLMGTRESLLVEEGGNKVGVS